MPICLLARLVDAITKNVGADVEVEEALREWQGELANQDWHGTVQLKVLHTRGVDFNKLSFFCVLKGDNFEKVPFRHF